MRPRRRSRSRLYVIAAVMLVVIVLYLTTDAGGGVQRRKFYQTTATKLEEASLAAAAAKQEAEAERAARRRERFMLSQNLAGSTSSDKKKDEDEQVVLTHENLDKKVQEEKEKEKEDDRGSSESEEFEEVSIAGRKKMSRPKQQSNQIKVQKGKDEAEQYLSHEQDENIREQTSGEQEAIAELNDILKRAPVIIFSKTYCPHSQRAKKILLDGYKIVPPPYVVELDDHSLGVELQDLLAKKTGRKTVPNILVNGVSLGGGDEIAALDREGFLVEKIKFIGGGVIMEVEKVEGSSD